MLRTVALSSEEQYPELYELIKKKLAAYGIMCVDAQKNGKRPASILTAEAVSNNEVDGGIVLSSYGIESSIIGNKFRGVRASHCTSATTAMLTRQHNDSNLLCIGAELLGTSKIVDIVDAWIISEFEGGRHSISLKMIKDGEDFQFPSVNTPWTTASVMHVDSNWPPKVLYIGCDHAGYKAKMAVQEYLGQREIPFVDIGTNSEDIVRYPYYAARIAHAVINEKEAAGILICGTGIGMSIAANKYKSIRAALCTDTTTAHWARYELDANILCAGGNIVGKFELLDIVSKWLETSHRHEQNDIIASIDLIDNAQLSYTDWAPSTNV